MNTVEFLSYLRSLDVAVRLDRDALQIDAPKGALTAKLREELAGRKQEIMTLLRDSAPSASAEAAIGRVPRDGDLPLSPAQQSLWLLDQMEGGSAAYVMPLATRLRGELDPAALEAAVTEIVTRHESLRTTFESRGGVPYQVVHGPAPVPLPVVDLRHLPEAERLREAERLAAADAHETFDLAKGPLLRVKLLALGDRDHVLLTAAHHIIFDGWSVGIFVRELAVLYRARLAGQPAALSSPEIQFADYASWQRRALDGGRRKKLVDYWLDELAGELAPLELPADRPRRGARESARGASCSVALPADLTEAIEKFCRAESATPAMLLLAAFELLMHRQSGQADILVGTPVAGRMPPETESLIGFFINTVVMRASFAAPQTFRELLRRVRETALDAYAHQDMPFEELVNLLGTARDPSRTPIFQVFFNHVSLDVPVLELPGIAVEPFGAQALESKFDLTFYTQKRGDVFTVLAVYDDELFDEARMQELVRQYELLLAQAVRDPDTLVEKYSLVTEGAREALPDPAAPIAASGGDAAGSRGNLCLAGLGENGDRIALEGTRGAWTFAELDALAEGLARRLVLEGLQRGEVVAVYARRDPILVCALLGVLRAGGAFAVLDPGYPDEGLAERWRAAAPRGLLSLTAAEPTDALAEVIAASSLRFDLKLRSKRDLESARQGARSAEIALPELRAEDWAYVAFTSGTTGGIKAIAGTHGPVAHFLDWQKSTFGLGADDRFSMLSGLAHDPLLRDVFAPLWAGARLCVPSEDALEDPSLLADWMGAAQPTVVHLAPAIAQLLGIAFGGSEQRAALGAWRYAFFGGDVLTGDIVARLREIAPNVTCVNFYGATETPQAMSHYVVPPDAKALRPRIPVGWGIDGVQLLVTTPQERLAGIGELGEILVRTPHLSLGYLGDEALTKRRFTPNPFTGEAGDRVYRTGDLGRYLPDGSVLFAGRRDGQVKLRGFRVELGEIEASLCRHESVSEAAVNVWTAGEGDTRLVAYVVARSGSSVGAAADLRKHLRSTLPDYMIPQHFVELSALPLTPNGKLDRKALPSPLSSTAEDVEAAADPPQGETERLIAAVWGEVLGDPEISRTDNFFELGGHSLLAMKAIALIEERTGWRASPRLLILEQLQEVARKCDTERPRAKPERPARGFLARLKGLVGDAE